MLRSRFLSGALGALVMQGLVVACTPSESVPGEIEEGDAGQTHGDGDQETEDDAPPPITTPAPGVKEASKLVQKDGGEVVTESGAVSVPKGAIDGDVTLKISQVDGSKVSAKQPSMLKSVSPATAFEPHKQEFKTSVSLTVFYEAKSKDNLVVLRVDDEKDTTWERVDAKFDNGAAVVTSKHFSIYTVSECDPAEDPEGYCQGLLSGATEINSLDPDLYRDFVAPTNFGDGKPEPDPGTMADAGVDLGTGGGKDAGTTTQHPPGAQVDAGVLPGDPTGPDPKADAGTGTGGHTTPDGGTTGSGDLDAGLPTPPNGWDGGGKDTYTPDGGWIPPWHGDGGAAGTFDGGSSCEPKQVCHPVMRCPADIPSKDGGAGTGTGAPAGATMASDAGVMDAGGPSPSQCPPEQLVEVQECGFICSTDDPCLIDPKLCGPDMPTGCAPTQNCQYVWECPPPPPSDAGSCPLILHCDPSPPCDGGAQCEPPKCTMVPSCAPPPECNPEDRIQIEHCDIGRVCDDPCLSIPTGPECGGGPAPNPCDPAKVQECQPLLGYCQQNPNSAECQPCNDTFKMCMK